MKENKPNNNNTPLSGKLDQITATNLLEDLQNPDIKIKKMHFKIYEVYHQHQVVKEQEKNFYLI